MYREAAYVITTFDPFCLRELEKGSGNIATALASCPSGMQ